MDFFVIVVLLLLVAFVAFLLLADSDLSLFVVQQFGKKLGEFQYRRWIGFSAASAQFLNLQLIIKRRALLQSFRLLAKYLHLLYSSFNILKCSRNFK